MPDEAVESEETTLGANSPSSDRSRLQGQPHRAVASPAQSTSPLNPSPTLLDLINLLAEKADPIVKLISTSVDRYQKGQEREIKFQIHMAWIAVLVIFLIIGVAAWLTYLGRVDGSTFTFLLGLIVGYVLTFIRDQIRSPEA